VATSLLTNSKKSICHDLEVKMNEKFIYDEKTSKLYAPDGTYLKTVFCPLALQWNQLVATDDEDRIKGCSSCNDEVINLDLMSVEGVLDHLNHKNGFFGWSQTCIHASGNSGNVVFLKDNDAPLRADEVEGQDGEPIVIHTARSFEDINRAVTMGYWPDVRLINYDTNELYSYITVGQNSDTGRIHTAGDLRGSFNPLQHMREEELEEYQKWTEIFPFTKYYQYYQPSPIAAYLIPSDIEDGAHITARDPIEDFVGGAHHGTTKAQNISGYIDNMKVILEPETIVVPDVIG
jgi:hypothetical protein